MAVVHPRVVGPQIAAARAVGIIEQLAQAHEVMQERLRGEVDPTVVGEQALRQARLERSEIDAVRRRLETLEGKPLRPVGTGAQSVVDSAPW